MIATSDIHWLAGLLEGEGYFGPKPGPTVHLAMTDKDVVECAHGLIGQGSKLGTRQWNKKWQLQYRFAIHGTKAIGVMMTILPLMGERRSQRIKEVIASWKEAPGRGNAWKNWTRKTKRFTHGGVS